MKKLILPFCLLIALRADEPHPKYMVRAEVPKGAYKSIATEDLVKELLTSGEVCKTAGHQWRAGMPDEGTGTVAKPGIGLYHADYHPGTNYRTCFACGLCQVQDLSWKDDK